MEDVKYKDVRVFGRWQSEGVGIGSIQSHNLVGDIPSTDQVLGFQCPIYGSADADEIAVTFTSDLWALRSVKRKKSPRFFVPK